MHYNFSMGHFWKLPTSFCRPSVVSSLFVFRRPAVPHHALSKKKYETRNARKIMRSTRVCVDGLLFEFITMTTAFRDSYIHSVGVHTQLYIQYNEMKFTSTKKELLNLLWIRVLGWDSLLLVQYYCHYQPKER